jgi:glycosyltransferase involved in cell wall biosynthesis
MLPLRTTDISVVICAHTEERWDLLLRSIASVRRQVRPAREVIVVVDHNEALLARLRQTVQGAVMIANSRHRGLSGARNSGVMAASGAVVAFLDDDAEADTQWLKHLASAYADDSVLGVGGHIEPNWPDGRPAWFPKEFDWVVGCSYDGLPMSRHTVRNLIGCNMSIRRDVLDDAGGFQSGLGRSGSKLSGACSCEETELCIRAGNARPDGMFVHEPRARVRHFVTPARKSWSYFRERCYVEGLSKAALTKRLGSQGGLASERTYTTRTLPQGVARGVRQALAGSDWAGLSRAGAILGGLTITTAGYVVGKATRA